MSFGGNVKLTGESEYKKALKEITSNLKVLGSEMKVVTSQYDSNDKSAENLSSQNEVLNKQIAEQEKKVNILKEALEKSKSETDSNSETTKKWQTQLNNAQAELNTLNKKLNDNTKTMDEAITATKDESEAIEDFGEEAEKSGGKALSLGDIIKGNLISDAIKGGLSALADGILSVGSAFTSSLTDGAEYADDILTLSTQTGLATETLQKYNAVSELTDVSLDTLSKSMARGIKSMSSGSDAYKQLGVTVTDANGNLRDSETVYWETIDALEKIENETERDALAMELFGKSAQELNPIIEMGSEGLKEYTDSASQMGAVLSQEGLEALGALDDQIQILKSTTTATSNIFASAFAPEITDVLKYTNNLTGAVNGLLSAVLSGDGKNTSYFIEEIGYELSNTMIEIVDVTDKIITVAGDLIDSFIAVINDNLPYILECGADLLSDLLSGISNNIGQLIPVVLDIVSTLTSTLLSNLPLLLEMGMQVIASLGSGIGEELPTLIPLLVDTVVLMCTTLIDNLDLILDAGMELLMGLADGLLEALPELIDSLPMIIDSIISFVTNNLSKIIEMGVELTVKLAAGLIKAIPQLVAKIPQIITSLVAGLKNGWSNMAEVGKNLLEGLWEGIKNAKDWLVDKVKSLGKTITTAVKEVLGIHSPSRVFRDEIGTNMALGLGEGFENTMKDITTDIQNSIPTEFDTSINAKMSGVTTTATFISYDLLVAAFKQALSEVKVVMDDREMGEFVTNTVEKAVYA